MEKEKDLNFSIKKETGKSKNLPKEDKNNNEKMHIEIKLSTPPKKLKLIAVKAKTNENEKDKEKEKEKKHKKIRKPRRSKEYVEGRNFICILCKKAYLSRPALHNHQKTKHELDELKSLPPGVSTEAAQLNFHNKKRGRPSKGIGIRYTKILNFLDNPKRKNKDLIKVQNLAQELTELTRSNPFEEFLYFIQPLTNAHFFGFAKLIIDMFNEFEKQANKKEDQNKNGRVIDKEHIPDLVNDYFRFVKKKQLIREREGKLEMIELIYIFCLWLKEKKYSTAKLEYNKNCK